jgi:hypothetical protein
MVGKKVWSISERREAQSGCHVRVEVKLEEEPGQFRVEVFVALPSHRRTVVCPALSFDGKTDKQSKERALLF